MTESPRDTVSMARTLSANALFEKLSLPQLAELCWAARPFEVEAGAVLYHQGEPSDEMWCIEGGRVRLTIRMPGGAEIRHLDLGAGETTGEMAFLDGGPCPTTATALERTWGVMIPRYAFEVLRTTFSPAAYEVFRRLATMAAGQLRAIVTTRVANVTAAHHHAAYQIVAGDRAEPTKLDFDQARTPAAELDRERLLLLPAFRRFSRAELDELLGYMHMLKIDRRVSIFREGDPAESCFITVRGAVQAQIERPGWVQKLGLSGPGQMFGHVALLDAGPRSASCVSRERSVLLELQRTTFEELTAAASPTAFKFLEGVVELLAATLREALRRSAWEAAPAGIGPNLPNGFAP